MNGPAQIILAHDYTLGDLHDLARLAVHTTWGAMAIDWHDRYDTAHSAIAEALFAAETPPARHVLVRAAQRAIHDEVADYRHHHGFNRHKTIGAAAGPGSSPKFATYWSEFGTTTPSPERVVVERLALHQILATLTDRQREALAALAVLENYRAAADALHIKPQTYRSLLGRARKEFFALWHEGETPSRPWGTDRRVASYAALEQASGGAA